MKANKILVVEDEALLWLDMVSTLQEAGLETAGPATTVESALAIIEHEEIDAALLDINLLGVKSFAVAEQLKRKGIPFAFVTAYAQTIVPPGLGDAPMILKPYEETKLLSVTRGLLAKDSPLA